MDRIGGIGMELTTGQIFFYGGLTGMAVIVLISIVIIIVMSGSRKRLRNKFNEEYGCRLK